MAGAGPTTEILDAHRPRCRHRGRLSLPQKVQRQLRHGPLLSKPLAQMDHVSEGRLQVELGTGWKQYEAEAFGYDWPSAPEWLGRLEATSKFPSLYGPAAMWSTTAISTDSMAPTAALTRCKSRTRRSWAAARSLHFVSPPSTPTSGTTGRSGYATGQTRRAPGSL